MRTVLAFLIVATAVPTLAGETAYLRGAKVSREFAVFGTVTFAGRTVATVNLGFAHGVKKYHQFLICRRMESQIVPISVLTIKQVLPERSKGTLSTKFHVKAKDYALIPARRLDIWGPESRLTTSSRRQLVRRLNGNRYDTRNFSLDLTKELAGDDAKKEREQPDGTWGAFAVRSEQFQAEADKKVGQPKTGEESKVDGLTTEEGESALLSAGFTRYLDQVIYEGGPKLTGEELLETPLDARNGFDDMLLVARRHRETLNSLAKREFGKLKPKTKTGLLPSVVSGNPY